jgi:hypothetical protein
VTRSIVVCSLTFCLALVAPELRAQTPSPEPKADQAALTDAVELKNGAYLRGLILEVDPATSLTIQLPTGEVRKIPVTEIVSAERSGKPLTFVKAETPPPTPPPTQPPKPVTEQPKREADRQLEAIPGPRVKLTLSANYDAFLERRIGGDHAQSNYVAYHFICQVPCSAELPANDPVSYRLDGDATEATEWFKLPKYNAHIRGELVNNMWPIWPRAMLVGGVLFTLTGGGMLAGWALADGSDGVRNVGIGLAATGGVLFLTSGILFIARPTSTYVIERTP